MLVVDLMHELESGDWRILFVHLLRMLETLDESRINELDRRYVLVNLWLTGSLITAFYTDSACCQYSAKTPSDESIRIARSYTKWLPMTMRTCYR